MSAPAAEWGGGYVTDIAYLPGYYPNQSPLHLNLACLIGGVAGVEIGPGTPLSYIELGCGQGVGALMLAASNPDWEVVGVDFHPAHIAGARALAAEAGIANARFVEADFADFAGDAAARDLPEADVVTMHGVWSWVGDAARAGIVHLLGTRLKPGGIAFLSYNVLPSWQGVVGMQRLLREAGRRASRQTDGQVGAGWEIVRALNQAGAHHLRSNPFAQALIRDSAQLPLGYLAHEFMNADWRPCFHADVAGALAAAKLDWVGSAQLLENFTPLMLQPSMRAVADRLGDPLLRELVKDLCLMRPLRQDVFVRGARRLPPAERDTALGRVTLALLRHEPHFAWEFEVPIGNAGMEKSFYGPLVAALEEGPRQIADLLAMPELSRRDNPGEVVGMLVGSNQALPVRGPPKPLDPRAAALNRAVLRRFFGPEQLDRSAALATSGLGAPLLCRLLDLWVAVRLQDDAAPDVVGWAGELGAGQPEPERARLREHLERMLAERVPVWRRLGAVPETAVR